MHGLALFEGVELHGTRADNLENDRNGAGFAVKPGDGQGMRSESSFARTMINWPAFAFLAMSGAWMQKFGYGGVQLPPFDDSKQSDLSFSLFFYKYTFIL